MNGLDAGGPADVDGASDGEQPPDMVGGDAVQSDPVGETKVGQAGGGDASDGGLAQREVVSAWR